MTAEELRDATRDCAEQDFAWLRAFGDKLGRLLEAPRPGESELDCRRRNTRIRDALAGNFKRRTE